MLGVLVDGIGREVRDYLLHPKEDDLLPSQRTAAAAAAAAGVDGGGGGGVALGGKAAPAGAAAAAAPAWPDSEVAAQQAQVAGQPAAQREHLPVLERVVREAPGEKPIC